jgi:hypothetical protein
MEKGEAMSLTHGARGRGVRVEAVLLIALILAGLPALSAAQSCTNEDPEIALSMADLGLGSAKMFYLSDFDPGDGSLDPLLFSFTMQNLGTQPRQLELWLIVDHEGELLLEGHSDPFDLIGGDVLTGTNRDLGDSGSRFELGTFDLSGAGEEMETLILETGYLPEGEYRFELSLREDGEILSVCVIILRVINPRAVSLISPGDAFSDDPPTQDFPNPVFQWQSAADRFTIRLCPVLEGDWSGEEVMENEPVFEKLDFDTGFAGTHSFLYPLSAEILEEGQSYCWQVEAEVQTSSGPVSFPSEIFCFRVDSSGRADWEDDFIAALLALLPPELQEDILAELEGLRPSGEFTVDGSAVTSAELLQLLETSLLDGWEVGDWEVQQ